MNYPIKNHLWNWIEFRITFVINSLLNTKSFIFKSKSIKKEYSKLEFLFGCFKITDMLSLLAITIEFTSRQLIKSNSTLIAFDDK